MARTALVVGAVLLVGGGAALGYALTRKGEAGGMTPEASGMMASAISKLDGEIKAARAGVESTARAIVPVPALRNAMSVGDGPTIADMIKKNDLAFNPATNETIDFLVVREGKPASILVVPAGRTSWAFTSAGSNERLDGDSIVVSNTMQVAFGNEAAAKAEKISAAYVTVSKALPLTPIVTPLVQAGIVGKLDVGGATHPIGNLPAGTATETKPLDSIPGAKLMVAAPGTSKSAMPIPIVAAGAGAAALGLVMILIGLLAGKKQAAPPQVAAPPTYQTQESVPPALAATAFSHTGVNAAGTPSPVQPASHPSGSLAFNPQDLGAGAMIGRWEVIRRLGSGGMADVYLAHSKGEAGFEKLVAIKVMHAHLARNQKAVEHFLDEARLAARIDHPNVIAIQDLGKIGNDYVIVMDYVDGVDLERLLASARTAGRPVPIDVALGILCRICDGLNAAHNAISPDGTPLGLIHRDVKSANVLISKQGGVKVVDFGIAKATAGQRAVMTVAGETKGTPSVMAPEQRVGEKVDVRVDVYAIGAIAYEILTGHAVNLDLAALAHLGIENWPHLPPPTQMRPTLPPELDQIVIGAMAYDRESRPANCAAFEATLEAVMKHHRFTVSDKDIARWVDNELRNLIPAYDGFSSVVSKPATP
ncbi:MAG TPA: serine/threonine-protein kinase [Kofleriaceae bacterium]